MEEESSTTTVEEVAAELGIESAPPTTTDPEPEETDNQEPDADQEQEPDKPEDEQTEEEKKFYKLTARERVQQAVNQAREAKQTAEQERQARIDLENRLKEIEARTIRPNLPFTPPEEIDHQKLNNWLIEKRDQAETLRLEGNVLAAELVEEEIIQTRRAYQDNIRKAQQWQQEQQQRRQAEQFRQQQANQVVGRLQAASDLVRQSYNVDPKAWDEGGKLFVDMMQSDPTLQAEFFERERLQGPVATVKWIYSIIGESMGKAAVEAKQKREQGKAASFGGSQSGTDQTTQQSKIWSLNRADFEKMVAQAKGLRS